MKIVSLNTWGGRAGKDNLLAFLRDHKDTDIFCLQEIWAAPYDNLEQKKVGGEEVYHKDIMIYGKQEISALLTDHDTYFRPHHGDNYGLMTMVRKNMKVREEGEVYVHKHKGFVPEDNVGKHARNIQYVTIEGKPTTIINFHGLWNGLGKEDSEDRLLQSDRIIEFVKTLKNPYVLCGDFNLSPHTQSLIKLEEFGLRNLIKEYGITSTRTSYYKKENRYADYVLVSPGITVKDFRVLPDEVSDHSPMYLEIE